MSKAASCDPLITALAASIKWTVNILDSDVVGPIK